MIPKTMHLYWGRNNPLSLLRYMTVISFSQLNPDWKIIVHCPEESNAGITWNSREHRLDMSTVDDYFDSLSSIPQCEIRQMDLNDIEPMPNLAEVMRSDLVRWKLLAEQGGWWSDFDILYIKPMSTLLIDDSVNVVGSYQQMRSGMKHWSIGFLGSDADDFAEVFYKNVLARALMECNPEKYQSCGQLAYTPVIEKWLGDKRLLALPPAIVYPIQSWEARYLFLNNAKRVSQETIGIHWYGGFEYSQKFESVINENTICRHHGFFANHLHSAWLQRST